MLSCVHQVNALDSYGVVRDGDGTLQEDLNQALNETFGGIELSEPKPMLLTPPGDPAGSPPRTQLVTPPDLTPATTSDFIESDVGSAPDTTPRFRKLTHKNWNVELPGTPPGQTSQLLRGLSCLFARLSPSVD